ncbi:MAG: carbohydrate binding domain-containing protein [Bacteroides sp.]|nr:carbohydrate binding domain-containing protein [Bacteroides sp.]
MIRKGASVLSRFWILFLLCGTGFILTAQNLQLVWADEFEAGTIDPSIWQYEFGPSNDNVQFYTNRTDNASVVDGKLRIMALKESYQGYEYTSAHIRTELAQSWRYGRMEASIKLPGTPGFVPAFWMLPLDDLYGWWPYSGEIDIMEHPTNEISKIYGTVHTETYNLFAGPLPPGSSTIDVPDAEGAFHLYAIEWTPEKIDFFVDDQKYFSFENDNGSSATWPFNQPFYIILNLAVGGGWVGTPNESTVFPAIMEVEYVRVYQDLNEVEIQGSEFVTYNTSDVTYSLGEIEGTSYQWKVPGDAEITSGQGSSQITINWGLFGGNVEAEMTTGMGTYIKTLPVRVSPNLLKNMGFEKGVKYWRSATGYPVKAQIALDGEVFHGGAHSIFSGVTDPSGNAWDVQLSQSGFVVQSGTKYHASFLAKSGATQNQISAAVINTSSFALAGQKTISPEVDWGLYEFDFIPSGNFAAAFNVDMGGNTGIYYLDDFVLTTRELSDLNLVNNPDFFDGEQAWALTTLSAAVAEGTIAKGEYAVSISNGGTSPWDIHLGQSGLPVENGFEYMVSFDAYADAPRPISPLVGKNDEPWTVYSDEEAISLTTTKQTFSFTFPMNEPTDLQSRLGFDIGGHGANVYFDNILLRKGEAINTTSNFSDNLLQSSASLRNYPNPFHNETTFYYTLEESAQVSIRILNLNGQELETIESGFQEKGEHIIRWASGKLSAGIYFYQLRVGEKLETRKLILLH